MLLLPFLVGVVRSGGSWAQVPLLASWLSGYCAFAATAQWLVSRRRRRHVPPMLTYATVAGVLGAGVVIARPDLLPWAIVFLPCVSVALSYAWRRNERSLVNDGVTILAACLAGLVAYQAGYAPGGAIEAGWVAMGAVTVALFAYLFGTSLVVKTVIRERASTAYRRASIAYHAAWTLAWGVVAVLPTDVRPVGLSHRGGLALTVLFALLTLRARLVAGRPIPPGRLGALEIGVCVVLFVLLTRIWQ